MSGTLSSSRDQKLAVPETRPLPAPGSLELTESLRRENDELRTALATRIVIERAKGILAERFNMHVDEAFERLHCEARNRRITLHALATALIARRPGPRTSFGRVNRIWRQGVGRARS